jgi:hypothetical protein
LLDCIAEVPSGLNKRILTENANPGTAASANYELGIIKAAYKK